MNSQWSSCIVGLGRQLQAKMCLLLHNDVLFVQHFYGYCCCCCCCFLSAEDFLDSPGTARLIHNLKLRISLVPLRLLTAAVIRLTPHGIQLPWEWVQPQIHLQSESDHSQSELWFWFVKLFLDDNPKS